MNPVRNLVASLTIALLASFMAGCIGADGEASMKDLYGAAKARAETWNENAVLVHAGTVEAADVEKWLGEDEEDAEEESADAADEEASADETGGDHGPPFELRNDPDVGNGRGTFWSFLFADPESGDILVLAVEASGEKVHVVEDDAGDEGFDMQGHPRLDWQLDSDTAASKAHANDDFHAASRKIQDPVYFVGLGLNDDAYDVDEESEEEGAGASAESEEAMDESETDARAIWVVTGMGMLKTDHADEPEGDDDSHDGMAMDEGGMGWAVAYAVIDAVDGRVIQAGAYDAEDWEDDYDFGFGWGEDGYAAMPEDFTSFHNSYGGRLSRAQPQADHVIPVDMDGLEMRVTFCWGRTTPAGSATFEVIGPDGDVLHEADADEGPLALDSGTIAWTLSGLVAGDYDVNVRLNGGLASDWGLDVWVGLGEPMDVQIQGPFGSNYGGC